MNENGKYIFIKPIFSKIKKNTFVKGTVHELFWPLACIYVVYVNDGNRV